MFASLRDLRIDIIDRVYFDNQDRFAIWMGSIGKAPEPCQQTSGCWHLTFDSFLNLDMGDDTNTKFLLLRVQTTYMTSKMRGDCWGTWLIMLGFMDLRWPMVCRRSTSVLLCILASVIRMSYQIYVRRRHIVYNIYMSYKDAINVG